MNAEQELIRKQCLRERRNASAREYAANHKEEAKQRGKAWRENNRERGLAFSRSYIKLHPEENRANVKRWRARHLDEYNAYQARKRREYYATHKEECRAYQKEWYHKRKVLLVAHSNLF